MRVNQPTTSQTQTAQSSEADKAKAARAAKKSGQTSESGVTGKGAATDGVHSEISSKARDAAQAKSIAAETSDVREDKIAEIKKRIASGAYSVDAKKVADKLVDEHITSAGLD